MLKNIDHRLNTDMLATLRSMGHGDTIVIVDRNFPSQSVAAHTSIGEPLLMENLSASEVTKIILSVMPVDNFVEDYALAMEVVGAANETPDVQKEVEAELKQPKARIKPYKKLRDLHFTRRRKTPMPLFKRVKRGFMGALYLKKA